MAIEGNKINYEENSIITVKKPHVCGSHDWKIIRTGADLKLECMGCQRVIMLPKFKVEKMIKR